jgi:porphobilinogen synthase
MFRPYFRPRRLRNTEQFREMVQETRLSIKNFIYPLFVTDGKDIKKEIPSMPGNFQLSINHILKEVKEIRNLGIPAIILFGIPSKKDPQGSDARSDQGIIQRAIRAIKDATPELVVISDVCFCEYTDHGHCGAIVNGKLDNDKTLDMLGEQVLTHAKAGVDMVAPSGMIDGMVGAIRETLDENNFCDIPIMSYAVKYASAFYGPFRDAAESAPKFGDRKSYQMDPANAMEAVREVQLDVEEGADIIMIKPALAYLDIIRTIRDTIDLPVAAYNVSGEFSMIKAASRLGWIDEKKIVLEIIISIKRAGADLILTYFAKDLARWLND